MVINLNIDDDLLVETKRLKEYEAIKGFRLLVSQEAFFCFAAALRGALLDTGLDTFFSACLAL